MYKWSKAVGSVGHAVNDSRIRFILQEHQVDTFVVDGTDIHGTRVANGQRPAALILFSKPQVAHGWKFEELLVVARRHKPQVMW